MRRRAEPKNHNPTLYIDRVISPKPFFISVACPNPILKSTKGNAMELGL